MKIKYKYIVIIAALAVIANTIGALVKILHWEFPIAGFGIGGSQILTVGTAFWIIGAVLLIIKAITSKGSDILNR